jgi:hypothetical protein
MAVRRLSIGKSQSAASDEANIPSMFRGVKKGKSSVKSLPSGDVMSPALKAQNTDARKHR